MATKTLTIMEDVYDMLIEKKLSSESFSEELRRIIAEKGRKRTFKDLFGIISKDMGDRMLKDLKDIKEKEIKMLEEKGL